MITDSEFMNYTLAAEKRTTKGEKSRLLGKIPAIVYGVEQKSESLDLGSTEFIKLYKAAGESTLVDLLVGGQNVGKVIIHEVQHDPVNDKVIHVDLMRINMNKEMTATIELHFIGEAPVVKEQGGTLVTTVHTIDVKCLPKDLVSHLDIDLGVIKTYENNIKIKDLKVPAGITIVKPHADDVIIKATRALTEDEIKKMEEEAAAMDVSKIESAKPKKEEEAVEGAEGAAAAGKPAAPASAEAAGKPAAKKEEKK